MRWKNILRCSRLWSKKNLFIIASFLILLTAGLIGEFIVSQRIIAQLLFLAVLGIAGQSIIRRGFFSLVKKSLDGDIKSFGELVEKYRQTVYALCYHRIGNFQDAQDLVQEIFLKVYLSLNQLRDPGKFSGWLYRIVINSCNLWLWKSSPPWHLITSLFNMPSFLLAISH